MANNYVPFGWSMPPALHGPARDPMLDSAVGARPPPPIPSGPVKVAPPTAELRSYDPPASMLLRNRLIEMGIPPRQAEAIAGIGGAIGGPAFEGGRNIAEGVAEGSPGQIALGSVMAAPFFGPGRLRPVMQTAGPPRDLTPFLSRPFGRAMSPRPPPGGDAPYEALGAAAGAYAGHELTEDGSPLASIVGPLAGGALGLDVGHLAGRGIARGLGALGNMRARRGAGRVVSGLPRVGRAPAGGGRMASMDEQREAVESYMRAGNRLRRGATAAEADQYVRAALAAWRSRRR